MLMAPHWYALRSKPRKEEAVWRQVRLGGYEVFFPRLKVSPVNPRSRKLLPYFPGYLFVSVDLDQVGLSVFQWMPHTVGIVSFGGEPAIVPDHLVSELKKRVKEISEAGGEIFYGMKPGDIVVIQNGPFQGYEAIFDSRIPGSERVRVLLELMVNQRQVPVELSAGQIVRKK
jgi:transcriptional antiterminator RfaH